MPLLEPLLTNGYVLSAIAPFVTKYTTKVVVETPAALHPLTYLPFHLVGHHLTARLFPNRRITYPAHLLFSMAQYCTEHYSVEFPTVAAFGPALVAIAIGSAPYTYYRAFKTTEGPKFLVWAALATFPLILFIFKGLELGFPKDTPEDQAAANLDRDHSVWHLVLHVAVLINQLMMSCGTPWTPKAQAEALVPSSPALSTRGVKRHVTTDEPCSPQSAKKRADPVKWPKAIKAA